MISKAGQKRTVDVLIVGAGLSGAACAKRLVDAGYDTILIEKRGLPRHKICSGILSPRGHRFLLENFGPLPREILHEPTSCRGVMFHFPSRKSMALNFDGGPTPHLHRKYSDYWAIKRSGVKVHDNTRFISLKDRGRYVDVHAKRGGEPISYRARAVIGADGPNSHVIQSVFPEYRKQIPWFVVGQRFHRIIDCPLDTDYFHFWFHPDLGYYTWSHARDDVQIVGNAFIRGDNFNKRHQNVVDYLREKHGVKLEPHEDGEACLENFGISLINKYVFGKSNVIITGQAAGFLNMMAEGMSCALHSGAIAGEAVIEAHRYNIPLQKVYRSMVASEVKRCSDQWNPLRIIFGRPHEADFREVFKGLKTGDQVKLIIEFIKFIRIFKGFGWGWQILQQALHRQFHNKYQTGQWL
ncbi:NAD(P)/FAD-dependent oxidoreductase [Thermodesulfobacteriota bacterium]